MKVLPDVSLDKEELELHLGRRQTTLGYVIRRYTRQGYCASDLDFAGIIDQAGEIAPRPPLSAEITKTNKTRLSSNRKQTTREYRHAVLLL